MSGSAARELYRRLQAVFLATRRFLTADAARFTAHRRFMASASRLRPSGVKLLLRVAGVSFGTASPDASCAAAFLAAQRFLSALMRRFFPSGDIPPLRVAGKPAASCEVATPSTSRSAARARSIAVFRRSSSAMMFVNPSATLFPLYNPAESHNPPARTSPINTA